MLQVKSPLVRMIVFSAVGIIFAATAYFSYLFAIAEHARKNLPRHWSSELGELTFEDIYAKIGRPQDDAAAKQYQNWIEYHWWGTKMLRIISGDCCKPSARPSQISYVVYANGRYVPVHYETLFRCDHGHGVSGHGVSADKRTRTGQ
jgi:hypothetical protein